MNDGQSAEHGADGFDEEPDPWEWVTDCDVEEFISTMQAIREGDPPETINGDKPQPANAIRALHAFATRREIADLIKSAGTNGFKYRDAVNVLATAALCRSVEETAKLTIGQWEAERAEGSGDTPKTEDIIRDIARQRTVLDVAVFVRECRAHRELVDRTLRAFAHSSSGRRNLDKALLYIALRDQDCLPEAADLLHLTLAAINENGAQQTPDTGPAKELDDLVGALYELSPSERILEEWLDRELRSPRRASETVQLVARLLAGSPAGAATLAEHVGCRWEPDVLVELCGQLSERPSERSAEQCAAVRRHAASHRDVWRLAAIVKAWQGSPILARTTRELLADVVTMGTARSEGPRSLEDIDDLAHVLRNRRAAPECNRLLRLVAAEHIDGRSGTDLAVLLHRVERRPRRDRPRVAQKIAERVTARTLEAQDNAVDLFVDYIKALHDMGDADAAFVARRELADPSRPDVKHRVWATAVADIAGCLWHAGLTGDSTDLLERYLENEQRVAPEDVAVVVERLHRSVADETLWRSLLAATVGRWSDANRRNRAISELRRRGCGAEAEEISRSLR
ncbi:hypothetical protein ACFW08_09200 [Streptomyces sp. NPDC058960]|uniref:hypothetical protein n=1 Tax=Streptomyces sp. NPDC058960 TaxID=3346679 RepID=UPI0036B7B159